MKYSFEEKKKKVTVAATVMFICVAGFICIMSGRIDKEVPKTELIIDDEVIGDDVPAEIEEADEMQEMEIMVHIVGAVNNPGVYSFRENARIADVIDKAGGYKKNAAKDYLNLAEHVGDGQKIIVYTKKQINNKENVQENDEAQRNSNVVNINFASKEELMTIPGIGESKANDIIAYRDKNGLFKNKEDIMNIPGIKEGIFAKISDMISI